MNISVLLTTYNDAFRAIHALTSLASQTLLPAEVIIADDGSTPDFRLVISG